jgi:hypothetical protein
MAVQPPATPPTPDEKLLRAHTRDPHSNWGKMPPGKPAPTDGDPGYTNIGSHAPAPVNPRKLAIHQAGMNGVKPPGGPKGGNAPIPAKQPKGR